MSEEKSPVPESEILLSSIMDSTDDLIWSVDSESLALRTFNRGLAEYYLNQGITIMKGQTALPPGTTEAKDRWRGFYRRALLEGHFSTEYETIASGRTLSLSMYAMRKDGEVFGISVFGKDITEQKRAERALRESELKYRYIIEHAPIGIFRRSIRGPYSDINPGLVRAFDCESRQDFIDRYGTVSKRWADLEEYESFVELMEQQGRVLGYEVKSRMFDGSFKWFLVSAQLVGDGTEIEGFSQDITDLKRAEENLEALNASLERRTEEVRLLLARVERERDEERVRVARELHDELGQGIAGIGLALHLLERRLAASGGIEGEGIVDKFKDMRSLLAEVSDGMKRLVADLRPSVLDRLGLPEALNRLAEENSERSGVRVECNCSVPDEAIPSEEAKTALYRVAKESLTNALKHSKCSGIRIALAAEEENWIIEVKDDGEGFDQGALAREAPKSFGIIGMRERCRALGGEFHVTSAPGSGTRVRATIPTR